MTFAPQRTLFGFLVMVYGKVGGWGKFLYDNFGLEKPHFYATSHVKLKLKNVSGKRKCQKLIHEYHIISNKVFLKNPK